MESTKTKTVRILASPLITGNEAWICTSRSLFGSTDQAPHPDQREGCFYRFHTRRLPTGTGKPLIIPGLTRWLALRRYNPFWSLPVWGNDLSNLEDQVQFLLYQKDNGRYGLLLPLIDGDLRASLSGSPEGLRISWSGALASTAVADACLLYALEGDEPFKLIQDAMLAVRDRLGSFRLRSQKPRPEILDWLGWCTWDAFYGTVDEGKVLDGLESFRSKGIPLGYMILDDGSWNAHGDYLNTVTVNPAKFKNGLKGLIRKAKTDYGLKRFGVWHCFMGYWGGVHPEGEVAKKYGCISARGCIRPWENPPVVQDLWLVDPQGIGDFFRTFHSYLHEEGADFIKVDGQGELEIFTQGVLGQGSTMKAFQQAMQASASLFFQGQVISCMSNGNDVAYNLMGSTLWRNSSDYVPGADFQQYHISANAYNALWSSNFAVPDWDMFQTHQPESAYHAACRAISGGPIYICDKPWMQDAALIRTLITSTGRVLGCLRPALPARDCLFEDLRKSARPLKLTNLNHKAGVLGLVNLREVTDQGPVTATFRAADIHDLPEAPGYACWNQARQTLGMVERHTPLETSIGWRSVEVVHFVPLESNGSTNLAERIEVAPLGLLDRFNSTAAVREGYWDARGRYRASLLDGGCQVGFMASRKPWRVGNGSENFSFTWDPDSDLVVVQVPEGGPVELILDFWPEAGRL